MGTSENWGTVLIGGEKTKEGGKHDRKKGGGGKKCLRLSHGFKEKNQ